MHACVCVLRARISGVLKFSPLRGSSFPPTKTHTSLHHLILPGCDPHTDTHTTPTNTTILTFNHVYTHTCTDISLFMQNLSHTFTQLFRIVRCMCVHLTGVGFINKKWIITSFKSKCPPVETCRNITWYQELVVNLQGLEKVYPKLFDCRVGCLLV